MPAQWPYSHPATLDNPSIEEEVTALLKGMTLEQKVGQMIQPDIKNVTPEEAARCHIGSVLSGGGGYPGDDAHASIADWVALADRFYEASLANNAPVPMMWGIDAVHGHNNVYGATLFPHNVGLGAAGDAALVHEISIATAREVAATGLEWTFAPTLAVALDTRWGRTYESYSSDAELVTAFAGPVVEGLQGLIGSNSFLTGEHVIATAKHFIGDGGTEDGQDQGDALCDESTLWETHGRAYEMAVAAGVQVVMASFSSWQGEKLHGHQYLLQQVLKDSMGFDGFIISDWNGHGQLALSSNVSGFEAINAGIDMLMAPEDWRGLLETTLTQVETGLIPLERIDDAARRILRVKLRAGLRFPNKPSERRLAGRTDVVGCPEHRLLARTAVRKSLVLLKNNPGTLPIMAGQRVLLTGPGADSIPMQCGGWSLNWQGDGVTNADFPQATSIRSAMSDAAAESGVELIYSTDDAQADQVDLAVVVFGESPYAEGHGDRQHLSYSSDSGDGLQMLRRLQAQGIKTISIFLSGRPLWINPELNASDALVAAWLPGSEGGGLADLLFAHRAFDFTGRLPFVWPANCTPDASGDVETLFPIGYGLTLSDQVETTSRLDETDSTLRLDLKLLEIFARRPIPPLKMYVGDEKQWSTPVNGATGVSQNGVVQVRTTDWQRQEDARRVRWGGGSGQLYFKAEGGLDCSALLSSGACIEIALCVHRTPTSSVMLRQDCESSQGIDVDVTQTLKQLPLEEWQLVRFDVGGVTDPKKLITPFLIWTEGSMEVSFGEIRLAPDKHSEAA